MTEDDPWGLRRRRCAGQGSGWCESLWGYLAISSDGVRDAGIWASGERLAAGGDQQAIPILAAEVDVVGLGSVADVLGIG